MQQTKKQTNKERNKDKRTNNGDEQRKATKQERK
jgi:hypothetical protein